MSDKASDNPQASVIFSGESEGISTDRLKELQEKLGLKLRVRSSAPAVDNLIGAVEEAAGHDRTVPGYDRDFDKSGSFAEELGEQAASV